ncbi:hypothetical protein EYF80_003543 [Liparis tanakae]|uniref:Uncharacterized protein n=1 Tax=Liparis tanakae TaxID=230148 RepID=A0A4Z2J7F2_9TELE|nr:hypothetical protein EYF80_003543 [Liparis tanakae]
MAPVGNDMQPSTTCPSQWLVTIARLFWDDDVSPGKERGGEANKGMRRLKSGQRWHQDAAATHLYTQERLSDTLRCVQEHGRGIDKKINKLRRGCLGEGAASEESGLPENGGEDRHRDMIIEAAQGVSKSDSLLGSRRIIRT